MRLKFDIVDYGESAAGLSGYTETVVIDVESGNPGGEPGEFMEFMRDSLKEWYDGAMIVAEDITRAEKTKIARMNESWAPNQESIKWIESYGVTLEQAQPAILEFRNYWLQRTTRRKDWDRSFRNNGMVQSVLLRIKNNGANRFASGKQTAQQNAGDSLRRDISRHMGGGIHGEDEGVIQGKNDG